MPNDEVESKFNNIKSKMEQQKEKAKEVSQEEENQQESKRVKEQKNKRINKEKSKRVKKEESKKVKRSYMLHKETVRNLKRIEIEEVDKNLSEIVELAINDYYRQNYQE